ncbi:MAG: hypothetical protein K2Y29_00290 [Beijerinckiaceae bacterium]|nr:hypothetical protein [Beijerinckiaceae bacterium]
MSTPKPRLRWRFPALWAQWTAAAFVAGMVVTALALALFAGLQSWRPGARVALGPSLSLERAIGPATAGRSADDTRVLAR